MLRTFLSPLSFFTSFTFLTLFTLNSLPAQNYETLRDSGLRAYDNLLFEDAIVQFEAAEVLAEGAQLVEVDSLIDWAKDGYRNAILREVKARVRADSVAKQRLENARVQKLIDLSTILKDSLPNHAIRLAVAAYERATLPSVKKNIEQLLLDLFGEYGYLEINSVKDFDIQGDSNRTLILSNGSVDLFDLNTGEPMYHYKDKFISKFGNKVAISPNGKMFSVSSLIRKTRIYKIESFGGASLIKAKISLGFNEFIHKMKYSNDGKYLFLCRSNKVLLIDAERGRVRKKISPPGYGFPITGKRPAHDCIIKKSTGEVIITGSSFIRAYSLKNGSFARDIIPNKLFSGLYISESTLSKNGETLISVGEKRLSGGIVIQWTPNLERVVHNFDGHKARVNSCALSVNSNLLITGGEEGVAKLWNLDTKRCLLNLAPNSQSTIDKVGITKDGKFILVLDSQRKLRIWNLTLTNAIEKWPSDVGVPPLTEEERLQYNLPADD